VWSRKVPSVSPVAKNGDFMASIVSTLMSPLYSKDRTTTPEVLQHDHSHDHDHEHEHEHDHPHEQHQH
jgi:ABC-type Zn2+ transport system substrate-binding protein/surface adhesin